MVPARRSRRVAGSPGMVHHANDDDGEPPRVVLSAPHERASHTAFGISGPGREIIYLTEFMGGSFWTDRIAQCREDEAMTATTRFDSIRIDRSLMRRWRDSDREPFAALKLMPIPRPCGSSPTPWTGDQRRDSRPDRGTVRQAGLRAMGPGNRRPGRVHRVYRAQPDAG